MDANGTTNTYRRISRRQPVTIPTNYVPTSMELTSLMVQEARAPHPRQTTSKLIAKLDLHGLGDLHNAISRLEEFYSRLGQRSVVERLTAWGRYVFDKLTAALAADPAYAYAD